MTVASPASPIPTHLLRPSLALRAQMNLPLINPARRRRRLLANGVIIKPLRPLAKPLAKRDEAKKCAQADHARIILRRSGSHK